MISNIFTLTHAPPTGEAISLDNTNKIEKKAVIIDKDGTHTRLVKGGVLSALNEKNEIVSWVSTRLQIDSS